MPGRDLRIKLAGWNRAEGYGGPLFCHFFPCNDPAVYSRVEPDFVLYSREMHVDATREPGPGIRGMYERRFK